MKLWLRIENTLAAIDETANAICGGDPHETISGTVGRACGYGGGTPNWWGPILRDLIDGMPWFGEGHCRTWAEIEQARRKALGDLAS